MFDVPGFLNVSLLLLDESNDPAAGDNCQCRYTYKIHPDLSFSWGMPVASTGLSFEGFADIIGSKGDNEFGGPTATETHFDGRLMYPLDAKKTFRVGFEYEYWANKFGNPSSVPGSKASTPMIKVDYHF